MTETVWLVVGLGNPPSYAGNRHNIGYMVLDELAAGPARPSARTRPAGPMSSRDGSADWAASAASGWSWPAAAAT